MQVKTKFKLKVVDKQYALPMHITVCMHTSVCVCVCIYTNKYIIMTFQHPNDIFNKNN